MISLGETPIAVLDIESTGLSPSSDRVVEVAVVRLAVEGPGFTSWDTLVNPERDPGPTHAHGLTTADLEHAPTFWDIAPELLEAIDGCILAAHNVNFDSSFLRYEFWRLGKVFPKFPLLDTVRVGYKLGRIEKSASRALHHLCANEGVQVYSAHSALGDAMAAAQLLRCYLSYAQAQGMDFADLAVAPLELPTSIAFPPRMPTKALRRK